MLRRWRLTILATLSLVVACGAGSESGAELQRVARGRAAAAVGPASGEPMPDPSSRRFDPAAMELRVEPVVRGLRQPTHVASPPDGTGRLFVVEKAGRVVIVRNGQMLARPFLDIRRLVGSRGSEQGLLSIAFHPHFPENGWFYVNYTDGNGDTVVARYTASAEPDVAHPESGTVLLHIAQPAPNHNGGLLLFGPDGYLYVGMGDGGGRGDQFRNAQSLSSLLGKMLRIDVEADTPYGVPLDNPFVGIEGARPEIWSYGLRNPWRYGFDPATGDLYIADVGQDRFEEVHVQPAGVGGQNYGWPIMEGFHCYPEARRCDPSGLEMPVAEYSHDLGCSITGGHVYRGRAFPEAQGVYVFGDFCSGRIWALDGAPEGPWRVTELLRTSLAISSFGEDEDGELYLTSLEPGALYRLVFQTRPS